MEKGLKPNRTMILAAAFAAMAGGAGGAWADPITTTWTGTNGTSWNDDGNWDMGKPTSADEAQFTDAGTGSPAPTISLDAPQTINQLTIATANGFTIGNATDVSTPNALTLTNVVRQDVSGTEANHVIAAPITLGADSNWTIDGAGQLEVTGVIGDGSNGYGLTKNGAGTLRLSAHMAYSGKTTVNQGSLVVSSSGNIAGSALVIGDGTHTASVTQGGDSVVGGNVTINAHGSLNNSGNVFHPTNMVIDGGTLYAGQIYTVSGTKITLKNGGLISGGYGWSAWAYNNSIVSPADSTATSTIASSVRISAGNYNGYQVTMNIYDGTAPIDLIISSTIGGENKRGFDKNQSGTLQLTGANSFKVSTASGLNVNAGTLLLDNASGSGNGQTLVTVHGGGTLGGAGFVGGVSGYTGANVSLTGTNASKLATLAPGSIDATSGDALIGKLTIGSATQNNNIAFGNYSQLLAQLGDAGQQDLLEVHGDLDLSGVNDLLSLAPLAGTTQDGLYTLATFTGTLTGRFDSALLADGSALPAGWQVQYLGTDLGGGNLGNGSIVVSVPEPGVLGLAALGLLGCLRRRRRI